MKLPIYQIDAFTSKTFGGNPAAVCPLESWLADETLQNIAMENALPETAFIKVSNNSFQKNTYEIRWFTPDIEMDLCGHATLASAYVVFNYLQTELNSVTFSSKSGDLIVTRNDDLLTLDFPSRKPEPVQMSEVPEAIINAFDTAPIEVLKSRDYVLVFESEDIIRNMQVDQKVLDQINLDPGGVCITARGDDVDFVSRFFTPQSHIFEDPVTGSAHCSLIPFWSERLNKTSLQALQLSSRVGTVTCQDKGKRVLISGNAVTHLKGEILI